LLDAVGDGTTQSTTTGRAGRASPLVVLVMPQSFVSEQQRQETAA